LLLSARARKLSFASCNRILFHLSLSLSLARKRARVGDANCFEMRRAVSENAPGAIPLQPTCTRRASQPRKMTRSLGRSTSPQCASSQADAPVAYTASRQRIAFHFIAFVIIDLVRDQSVRGKESSLSSVHCKFIKC
jgi:hypothetical protein